MIILNVECLLSASELVVTGTKCGGPPGEPMSHMVSAPDTQPKIEAAIGPPPYDPTQVIISYEFPNATNRKVRAFLKGDKIYDVNVGGTNLAGNVGFPINLAQQQGTIIVKAVACDVRTATDTVTVVDEDCTCKDDECPEAPKCVGDPVHTDSGNMRYQDTDPLPANPFMPFVRTYNSRSISTGFFGPRWSSLLDAKLYSVVDAVDNRRYVTVISENRKELVFEGIDGVFSQIGPGGPGNAKLVLQTDGTWLQTDASGRLARIFSSVGLPVAYREVATGREVRITWSNSLATALPIAIADSWGNWALTIGSNASGRITSISVDGQTAHTWQYLYNGDLITVQSPHGVWRSYEYGGRLVRSRDGLGNVIESHDDYDAQGRALISRGPSGEINPIDFNVSGRNAGERATTITYDNGRVETRYRRSVRGVWRTTEIVNGCAACGAANILVLYDKFGNAWRTQDAHGYITARTYDATGKHLVQTLTALRPPSCDPQTDAYHCRLTELALKDLSTLAFTTATMQTEFEYNDPNWPDRVTKTTRFSALKPGGSVVDAVSYDALTGQILSRTTTGWTGNPLRQETRVTATTLYNGTEGAAFAPGGAFLPAWSSLAQPRLPSSVNGPLDGTGDTTSFVYYPIHASVPAGLRGQLAATKNALGHITRYEDYDVFGHARTVVDANGVEQFFTFDKLGRPLTATTGGFCDPLADPPCDDEPPSVWTYPGAGPLASMTRPGGGVTSYTYDARTRIRTISRGSSATEMLERIEYGYDVLTGKKNAERFLAWENSAWVEKRRADFVYDEFQQLSRIDLPGGASSAYQYEAGHLVAHRDENHASFNTFYKYDPAGRVREVRQTLGTGNVVTTYQYDVHGNLTLVSDPNGNGTQYTFDDFGQMLQQVSPVSGTTTYEYDKGGRLVLTRDANSATTTRGYDLLGRATSSQSVRDARTETVSWTYDTGTFGKGRLATMTDPSGSSAYKYDRRGQLIEDAKTISGTTYVTTFLYDDDGNRFRIGYPSGRVVSYGFDYAGRPSSATVGTTPLVSSASYLPFGPMTGTVFANGTTRATTYDARYQTDTHRLLGPGGAIASYDYAHDAAGNVQFIHDLLAPAYDRNFLYDDLNRLTNANTGAALWGTGSFAYDAMGNLTALTLGTSRSASFSYRGTTPKILAETQNGISRGVAYDGAGNETGVGTSLVFHSPRNHVLAEGASAYEYDGRGLRVTRTCGGPDAIAPVAVSVAATASSGSFAVEATCAWTATTPTSWITLTTATGNGNGSVAYAVALNPTTAARTGTIVVGTRLYTVTQAGAAAPMPFRSDFDGDGYADTLIRDSATGELRLLLMKGNASAQSHTIATLPRRSIVVGTGDFWGDGFVSLVVFNRDNREVVLWRMNGAAVVSKTLVRAIVSRHWQIVGTGDFNGDGRTDLLLRNDTARQLSVWQLNGSAVILDPVLSQTLDDSRWGVAAVADFTGEGKADILLRHSGNGRLSLWEMDGTNVLSIGELSAAPASTVWRVEDASDHDGDGKADILLRNATTAVLQVWRMNGRGVLSQTSVGTVPDRRKRVAAFEKFTSDARADVLLRNSGDGSLELWESDGATLVAGSAFSTLPTLRWSVQAPPRFRASAARSDYGGDGQSDILLRHSASNELAMWEMSGRTVLADQAFATMSGSAWKVTRIADVTGDRLSDLFLELDQTRYVALWEMLGRSVLNSDIVGQLTGMTVLALGDFDGDGNAELLLQNDSTREVVAAAITSHQVGSTWSLGTMNAAWHLAAVGDFNGDGTDDLMLRSGTAMELWETRGPAGTDKVSFGSVAAAEWTVAGSGDANGDGMADLLWRNGSAVALWEMNGRTLLGAAHFASVSAPEWQFRGTGDYNGDRQMDILLRHSGTQSVAMWELNGASVLDDNVFGVIQSSSWVVQPPGAPSGTTAVEAPAALSDPAGARANASTHGPPWWTPAASRVPTWLPPLNPHLPTFLRLPAATPTSRPGSGAPTWLPPSGPHATADPATTSLAPEARPAATPSADASTPISLVAAGTPRQHYLYTPELSLLAETQLAATAPAIAYEYVWFAGQPLAQLDASGTISYYFNDHLGTPLLQTDAAAAVVWRAEYEPYGAVHAFRAGATRHQPLRFPGQEARGDSELSYNVFRWYRASFARFTQSDPILPFMHSYMTREVSLRTRLPMMVGYFTNYAYVGARPITSADPLGLGVFPGFGEYSVDESCTPKQCAKFWPLDEDVDKTGPNTPLGPPLPPGGSMNADAVYWKQTILKIPDNCNAKLVCTSGVPIIKLTCLPVFPQKPEKFVKGTPPLPPAEWPPFKP